MKYIVLIIGLLVVGCGKQEQTDTEKPVKELTLREKVVGEYEMKEGEDTLRIVLLENGVGEEYVNGKKDGECKWIISKEGEMHIIDEGETGVFRINKNGNLTGIALIVDGERDYFPKKEEQVTIKKIK